MADETLCACDPVRACVWGGGGGGGGGVCVCVLCVCGGGGGGVCVDVCVCARARDFMCVAMFCMKMLIFVCFVRLYIDLY